MMRKNFNLVASVGAFIIGTAYMFSDGASIDANVIGASGSSAGVASVIGIFLVIGAIGLFIITMSSTDNHSIKLEQLIRRTKNHEDLNAQPKQQEDEYKDMAEQEKIAKR
jgi:hypothetical protein